MRRFLIATFVCAGLVLAHTNVAAGDGESPPPDPCTEFEPGQCTLRLKEGATTPKGTILPPGYYLDPATYARLDDELRRLQESETRLKAERESLLKDAKPVWYWVAGALVAGFAAGYALSR